ncbi:MAG TPA: NADH-quinone oxidoreductase subunit N [Methanomassiliicoccaceae archaeon]|jgi:proton-translocating NADH-quinone oxidoreductase chain N|nr:NADH-quinone oxidoreductase subunit N [Methanomassiliicoccaceae archaeon]HOQ25291.1 NADH-quinone oxidoreductase subunit N [Methanomassiliicoccaceae archaeon]HPT74221.1 NADH-quinone oxidoreductase subunit N [Methanomassiliicoccaceae archaeon]HQA20640.1 NADH-quinone oxidoreductase subunit N [Methanomassiliicoccaceae archaeon]HQD87168.1 NADH-quinone oxidoreductase subunit N [Methanomassiliicoccaceae archaeon]
MFDYGAIYPEIILILFAVAIPALHLLLKSSRALAGISLVGVAASAGMVVYYLLNGYPGMIGSENSPLIVFDALAAVFSLVFLSVAFVAILASARYVENDRHLAEYFTLILMATAGMMLVASAQDLLTIYIGIEIASMATYALVAFRKRDKRGSEAAVKYVIIGGLSSALSLYGISLLFGVTGTTSLVGINEALAAQGIDLATILSVGLLIAGFGFKIAIAPFHMWAPDVYEGAPTPVSAFLAAASKKMGLVVMFKVFIVGLIAIKADWDIVVGVVAILTMTIGNVIALSQTNIKRMLAYSSIAQAGYMLMALPLATVVGDFAITAGIFHIITHAFMKSGAFIVVAALAYVAIGESVADYKGLAKRAPFMAFSMAIFMFALAGIPPLSGFMSKVVLLSASVQAAEITQWMLWLGVALVLNSALSLYYYVRVIKYMYVEKGESTAKIKVPVSLTVAIAVCMVATIVLGLFFDPVLDLCSEAARTLFPAMA